MAKTIDELKAQANQIKNETGQGANTASRIGQMNLDLVEKIESERTENATRFSTLDQDRIKKTTELNISVLYPTQGIGGTNKYDLATAIAQAPAEYRTAGIKVSFVNENNDIETFEYLGKGMAWSANSFLRTGAEKIKEIGSLIKIDNIENVEITYRDNYWWNGTTFVSNEGYHCTEKHLVKAGDIVFIKGQMSSAASVRLSYLHNNLDELIYQSESYCSNDIVPVFEDGYIIANSIKDYNIKIGLIIKETFTSLILERIINNKKTLTQFLDVDYANFVSETLTSQEELHSTIDKNKKQLVSQEIGKNLFDNSSIVENTRAQDIEDGRTPGAKSSLWIKVKPVKYTLSNQSVSIKKTYTIAYKKDGESALLTETARNVGGTSYYVFDNTEGKADYIRFSSYNVSDADTILTCQIEEGDIMTDYEEYVAPKDIPNPTFYEKYENTSQHFNDIIDNYKIVQVSDNKFDKSLAQTGVLVETGNIDSSQTNYFTSDYISLKPGEQFKLVSFWNNVKDIQSPVSVCFYDADRVLIEKAAASSRIMRCLDERCSFFRFSLSTIYLDVIVLLINDIIDEKINEYVPYMLKIVFVDKYDEKKSIAADGDSITFGVKPSESTYPAYAGMTSGESYIDLVAHDLGADLFKFAISASTLAYFKDGSNPQNALVDRYILLPDDVDIVYIAIGSNDWAYNDVLLGEYGDTDKTTFYGALKILCEGLKQKYPSTPVVFATPIKRRLEGRGEYDNKKGYSNLEGKYIEDYGNAIKEVCGYFGYPVIDMEKLSIVNAWLDGDIERLIPDGIHPNHLGHKLIKNPCKQNILGYLSPVHYL